MKVNPHTLAMAVGVTWLLMALCPPWIGVSYNDGMPGLTWSAGYSPIFAPPNLLVKCVAHAHIDFVRLAVQYLVSSLAILGFGKLTRRTWTSPTRPERMQAAYITASCLAVSAFFLATDAVSQLTPVPTRAVCLSNPIAAGDVITEADCSFMYGDVPSDSLQNVSDVVGHRVKRSLGYWALLKKSNIE